MGAGAGIGVALTENAEGKMMHRLSLLSLLTNTGGKEQKEDNYYLLDHYRVVQRY